MKKLFFVLVFMPFISFSQGMPSNSINWISLSEGEKYSEKYKKNMLIYFYRNNCDYCKRMKDEVLTDPQIVKLINENFFPVKLDGKTKKSIKYNGKNYINDVSIEEDPKSSWRHNLFFELVTPTKGNFYWPTIVIIDGEDKKVAQLPGFRSKQQLLRSLGKLK
tara:strand:+ start:2509 stop:2997 length:489 start_codon:yes stop_codon:yes gene_type:complete